MAAPERTQGNTTDQHGTTQVKGTLAQDYVTVVGASYQKLIDAARSQYGNKMSFINQGIRQISLYPPGTKNFSVQRVFLIFKDDYEAPLLEALKDVIENRHGAQYREIDSVSGLVDFIHTRQRKGREIKQMDFFSHGVVWTIEFGYELDKRDSYRFRDAQAKMFAPEAFAYGATITSYACRTGLGIDAYYYVSEGEDPHYELSLAQILADQTKAAVKAYPVRSNYDQTYGNAQTNKELKAAQQKTEADMKAGMGHREQLTAYYQRLAAHRAKTQDPAATLPDPAPPAPEKTASADDVKLIQRAQARDKNAARLKYPLDPQGAVVGVRAGDSPSGLPQRLFTYKNGQAPQ